MTHSTITDVRDLDCVYLATIGGCDYYETRQIVREASSVRSVIGRASDWPLIQRDARIRELTALLTASEQRSVEADTHCVELISRLSGYEEHITALEAARGETQRSEITRPEAETAEAAFLTSIALLEEVDDGKIPCDYPGCEARMKPRGLPPHKKKAHGIAGVIGSKPQRSADHQPSMDDRRKCPHCNAQPKLAGLQAHIERKHPEQITVVAVPTPVPIALALGEKPWRCAQCLDTTHARSLANPALCIRCVISLTDVALHNGHQVAA